MNRFRKVLCVALVLLLLVASVPAVPVADLGFGITASALNATGKCGKTATYTFDSATGELVISGTGVLAAEAFYQNDEIKNVVINDGITEIGADAFNNCDNLTTVDLGNTVTVIGDKAFYGCYNLTSIDLPNSVTIIGTSAFQYCYNLKDVIIPDGVTTISDNAFFDCDGIANIIIPDSVVTIGQQAFIGCNNLESVDIGDGVTTIGWQAFGGCDNLTSIKMGNNIINIDYYAFSECRALESIVIPDSVKYIGGNAFESCANLTEITIGNNAERIESRAFYKCNGFESINIPKSVRYIGEEAFRYCSNLWDVYYEGSEEEWLAIEFGQNNTALDNATIHFAETHTHTWDVEEITVYPTCTSEGEKIIRCKNAICQKTEVVPKKEHQCYEWDRVYPSCTENGYTKYHCHYCDYTYIGDEVPAYGHNFVDYYSDGNATCAKNGTKTATCNRCWSEKDTIEDVGSKDNVAHKFSGGQCTVCGAYTTSCQHNNLAWYDGYDATCTSEGFKEHYECKDCYQYLDSNKYVVDKYDLIVPKGEHNFAKYVYNVNSETCTREGTETATCANGGCDATHTRYKVGTMVAHTFKNYVSDGNATCIADGTKSAVCEMCKEAKDIVADKDSHKVAPHKPDSTGRKCELCNAELVCTHTYSVEKLITKTPTCTTDGQKAIVCSKCKAIKPGSEEVVPKTGHAWDEGEVITAASCKEKGLKKYKCNNMCGETKTEEIAVKPHNYKEVITHATCTEDGYSTFTCTMCGSHYVDKLVKAYGHMFDTYFHDEGSATCYKDGTRTSECANGCGTKNTIADPGSKTDHEMTDFSVITPATCTEDGEEEAKCFYFDNCGYSEIVPVDALGHDELAEFEIVKEPTCTEKGEKRKVCARCPEIVATEEIPALGHNFINNTCTRCGAVNGNPTPDTGDHTYPDQWSVIIPATCKETGVAVKVCFDCHEVIAMVVPKVGHSDFDGDSKCDTCGGTITVVEPEKPAEKPEEKPCNCDCHAGGIKAFFFKLINFFAKIFDKNARVCDCGKAH